MNDRSPSPKLAHSSASALGWRLRVILSLFAVWCSAVSAQSFNLLTPQLPDAVSGRSYVGNLMLSGVTDNSTVTLTGLPLGLTAAHNGKGSISITGVSNAPPVTYPLTIRATTPPVTVEFAIDLRLLQAADPANVSIGTFAAGRTHTCAVVNGGVQCWGSNAKAQLGNSTPASGSQLPVPTVAGGAGASKVSSNYDHTCAIVDGGLQCWGSNDTGQIGDGKSTNASRPVSIFPANSSVTDVAAGKTHTCAVVANAAYCWGSNTNGELGTADTQSRLAPSQVTGLGTQVSAVAVGDQATCAIVAGGVRCWGSNTSGALGNNDTVNSTVPVQAIPAGSDVTHIAVGGAGACAVARGGLRCWGANDSGQVGNGQQGASWSPFVIFAENSGVSDVSATDKAFCAIVSGGLQCWGQNIENRLGTLGDVTRTPATAFFSSGANVASHSLGREHSCVRVGTTLQCWGNALGGRLGTYGVEFSRVPVQVVPAGSASTITSAGQGHTCAVANGGIRCWGDNSYGQLGNGNLTSSLLPVVAIAEGSGASHVSSGWHHTCAVVSSAIWCWGRNNEGQLGNASRQDSSIPVLAVAASEVGMSVSVGETHTCAVVSNGVRCWGNNANGQLGNPNFPTRSLTQVLVLAPAQGASSVATGQNHTCAVINDGVRCWGSNNFGQLGDGSLTTRFSPVAPIEGSNAASAVAAGTNHSCAVAGNVLKCWGANESGQLGRTVSTNVTSPVNVDMIGSGVSSVAAGEFHTCALSNGGVRCWGGNLRGQLGQASSDAIVISPVQTIAEGSGLANLTAAGSHNCVTINGGGLCWGNNTRGQLSQPIGSSRAPSSVLFYVAPQTIVFTQPAAQLLGMQTVQLTATTSSGLAVRFETSTPQVCTVSGSVVTLLSVGTCTITATQLGSVSYAAAAPIERSFQVTQNAQSIVVSALAPQRFDTGAVLIDATATSRLAVLLASTSPSVCTITGSRAIFVSVGLCTITATQDGNAAYAPATPVTISFTIGLGAQTITMTTPTSQAFGASPILVNATASSGLTVSLSSATPSVCSVSGLFVSLLSAGLCTISAAQDGNATYAPATPVTISFTIGLGAQTITMTSPTNQVFGTSPILVNATASSGLTVSLSSATPPVCSVSGLFVSLLSSGLCTIVASQPGDARYAAALTLSTSFTVSPATQTISFAAIAPRSISSGSVPLTASASSGLPVVFSSLTPSNCTVTIQSVTPLRLGICTVSAEQSGNSNYLPAAPVSNSFTITPANQTITFAALPSQPISRGRVTLNASSTSGLPIRFVSQTSSTCSIDGNAATLVATGTCTISANQDGDSTYGPAESVTQSFVIVTNDQTIRFDQIPTQSLSTQTLSLSATATSGLSVQFSSLSPAVCTVAGTTLTLLSEGTCAIVASQPGDTRTAAAASITRSFEVVASTVLTVANATLASSKNPTIAGESFVLIATITGRLPSGVVRFATYVGNTLTDVCPTAQLGVAVGSGDTAIATATCVVQAAFRSQATQTYVAIYAGNGFNSSATASMTQVINNAAANVTLTYSPTKSFVGQPVTANVSVSGNSPTGTVTFFENGAPVTGCTARPLQPLPGSLTPRTAVTTCLLPTSSSAGERTVLASYSGDGANGAASATSVLSVGRQQDGPAIDYSDLWWGGASENGWGLSISQRGATLFNAIYIYDATGKPVWFVMPGGTWSSDFKTYSGALYLPTSAPLFTYSATRFVPGSAVGTASLTFQDANTATLQYSVNSTAGVGSGTKSISRQLFGAPDNAARINVSGLWWNPSEDGWGIAINQQSRTLFITWYTYAPDGKTTWYVVPGGSWEGSQFRGDLYATTSSPWIGTTYDSKAVAATKMGAVTVEFINANEAILTYSIGGISQSKTITRQIY